MSGQQIGPAPWFAEIAGGPETARAEWWRAADGVRLRVMIAQPSRRPRALVAILPGRTEWIEKYGRVAAALVARGHAVVVPDWRGQGLSDRVARNRPVGHVRDFAEYQTDLAAVLAAARDAVGPLPLLLVSHSMGGTIALRALASGLTARAAAFFGPLWGMPWPLARRLATRVLVRLLVTVLRPLGRDTDYLPGAGPIWGPRHVSFARNRLTHDPEEWARLGAHLRAHPELMVAGPSVGWFDAVLTELAALRRLPVPDVPALVMAGDDDRVVSMAAIENRLSGWSSARLQRIPGAYHEVLMERPAARDAALAAMGALFDDVLAASDKVPVASPAASTRFRSPG